MAPSPITCHVLNTLSGTPASELEAVLTLLSSNPALDEAAQGAIDFHAVTDQDGRVKEWKAKTDLSVEDVMSKFSLGDRMVWSIRFSVGTWYEARNVESFFPEVEVKFYVNNEARHYHVPVLVGPWTYTTYRGS